MTENLNFSYKESKFVWQFFELSFDPLFSVELGHLRKHCSFIWKFQMPENS